MAVSWKRFGPSIHNLRRALSFVWESSRKWALANLALVVIQGLLPLGSLYLIKLLVDEVSGGFTGSDLSIPLESIVYLILAMGGVAFLSHAFGTLANLVSKFQTQMVIDHMHGLIHAKSIEVDLEYYENSEYYDMMHRAQQEAPYRPMAILNALLGIGQNGISLLAMVGLLWWFHWAVVPLLVLAALPDVFVRLRYSSMMYAWERQRTPEERKAWYLNWLLTQDTHAKEVRLFDIGNRFSQMFQDIRTLLRIEQLGIEKRHAMSMLGAQAVGTLGVFGVYFFVAYRTAHGLITVGDLVMYFQAIQRGSGYLQSVGGNFSSLYESNLFLNNLEEFLNVRSHVTNPPQPLSLPRPIKEGLCFDRVSFTYRDQERPALTDLSFTIHPGEHIALVGENGAGKTTLVKLLCRLYDPSSGSITLDGRKVRQFSLTEFRGAISVIFQDFAKYYLTAHENIAMGDDKGSESFRVIEAARQAGVDERLCLLPQGYQTVLGKWFEGGQELSAGEWQKVAIARAFFRDSQILVLDEPTSAMDAKAEAELFERFHELARGRMAVLISHRLSTVKMADRIYVLDKGRIVETGTHAELVQKNGEYAKLYLTQARHYK